MSQKNNNSEEASGAARRFRLPKLFADSADDTLPQELIDSAGQQDEASTKLTREYSLDAPPKSFAAASLAERYNEDLPTRAHARDAGEYSQLNENSLHDDASLPSTLLTADSARATENAAREAERFKAQLAAQHATASTPAPGAAYAAVLLQEMEQMRDDMDGMARVMTEIREHGTAQDKIFDTLHAELQGYKNDFIYEHLKPVVRPLLFLYDSMEQFDGEMLGFEQSYPDERREFSPALVRENVIFFRSQLVEALRICEVVPMETPEGFFEPRLHKAVDVVSRLVRSGWYLNGRVFRPAEVVVGRCEDGNDEATWNAEMTATNDAENNNATP